MTRASLAGFAMLVTLSAPTVAQLRPEAPIGSILRKDPNRLAKKDAGIVQKNIARCMYRSSRKVADALLLHSDAFQVDLRAAGIKGVRKSLDMEDCLGREFGANESALGWRFSPPTLRDMLAEEAYLAQFKTRPAMASPPLPLAKRPAVVPMFQAASDSFGEFNDCTVRANLPGTDALLRTTPGSDAEHNAATALAPAIGKCMFSDERQILTPASIRAFVAYGLWNRFVRPPAP